jgi:Rgg/GadR/MutR family transcriptional activator
MNKNLGKIYKQIRVSRGLTILDAAGLTVDKSFISKFENGQSDISLTRFIQILENIGMNISSFSEIAELDKIDFSKWMLEVSNEFYEMNYPSLFETKNSSLKMFSKTNNKIYKINSILISAILQAENLDTVNEDDISFINEYLFNIHEWSLYEYRIFSNLIHVMPEEISDKYLNEIFTKYNNVSIEKQIYIIRTIENRIVLSVDTNEIENGYYWLNKLNEITIPQGESYLTIKKRLLLGMLKIIDGKPIIGRKIVEDEITNLKKSGFEIKAEYHKTQLEKII